MDAMLGIGRISETSVPRPLRVRDRQNDRETSATQDGIQISDEAQEASEILRTAQSATVPDVRQERVDQAKASIEEGVYRLQEVVRYVAGRVSHFV